MKPIFRIAAALFILYSLSPILAQPRLSLGFAGGVQIRPRHFTQMPMLGASAWYHAGKSIWLSGEYLRNRGCDQYPAALADLVVVPAGYKSQTQRLVAGVHYALLAKSTSARSLIGLSFGQRWDKCSYGLHEISLREPVDLELKTEYAQHSLLLASWTAWVQNGRFPLFVQARYGFAFRRWSEMAAGSIGQVILGLHFGIF